VSECLLIAAFRSGSHNLRHAVSSMGLVYLRQLSLPTIRRFFTAPPSRRNIRASDSSCVRNMGEGVRWGKHVSGNRMKQASSCLPLRQFETCGCTGAPAVGCTGGGGNCCACGSESRTKKSSVLERLGLCVQVVLTQAKPVNHEPCSDTALSCG